MPQMPGAWPGTPYDAAKADDLRAAQEFERQRQDYDQGAPIVGRQRVIVKAPRPRYKGGLEFYGGVPKRSSTFAWSELCATPEPENSLAPTPQVTQKSWYNTYLYVPEEQSHTERQYLERFVEGPNGEWIDTLMCQRHHNFLEEKRLERLRDQMEREAMKRGHDCHITSFQDPYSGEHYVVSGGRLVLREHLRGQNHKIPHDFIPPLSELVDLKPEQFDFANLRVPWPFSEPERNKPVQQRVYDWFDRHYNPDIVHDRSFDVLELPSMYVDRYEYTMNIETVQELQRDAEAARLDEPQRVSHVQL